VYVVSGSSIYDLHVKKLPFLGGAYWDLIVFQFLKWTDWAHVNTSKCIDGCLLVTGEENILNCCPCLLSGVFQVATWGMTYPQLQSPKWICLHWLMHRGVTWYQLETACVWIMGLTMGEYRACYFTNWYFIWLNAETNKPLSFNSMHYFTKYKWVIM